MKCNHNNVYCLNQYDKFRKYYCEDCGGVYICKCEEKLALTFLPYQTERAIEYETHDEFLVTGFAFNICNECKGKKEKPYPLAATYGRKGKVERFYWREIFKTYCEYVFEWLQNNSIKVKNLSEFQTKYPDLAKEFKLKSKNTGNHYIRTIQNMIEKKEQNLNFFLQ